MKIQQQIPLQNYCPHLFSDRWGAACGGTLISYTSFEQPNTLTESPCQATFKYNTEGQRASMVVTQNGSNRGFPPTGERVGGFWIGGDAFTAPCVVAKTGDTTNWYYVLRDHLGTITHVTNASGTVQNQYSFDAWGRRRNFSNWGYTVATQTDLLPSRGFTSHEWLPWFNLYNMNGRLYDPVVGRFLSPDPIVQNPAYSQNLNRYSYVLNNPLRYNDPSGYRIRIAPGEDETYINHDALRYIGGGRIGPGSGKHWSDSFRSWQGNFFLMGQNTFNSMYGSGSWNEAAKAIYSQPWFDSGRNDNETIWKQVGFYYYDNTGRPIMTPTGMSGEFWIMEFGKYKANIAAGAGGSQISMDASHNRIGFVPLDVGSNYGAYQIANYRSNISVRGNQNQISIRASSSNTPVSGGQVVFGARASLFINGNITQTQVLANGLAVFNLPDSQNISLTVNGGWTVRYDYGGAAVPVFHPIFWPFSLNFTDNFKLK